ncbi:MAG: glutamate 5-kinase [Bacteroidales bacterium]|nr:glutamate 5-kinase [Bacteroidales bacterium]MCD8393243.1 glutamate 5-kinase [Bacteroidales bacterium]
MKYSRLAVKIGSNVLSRADGTLDITRMSALVDQVSDLRRRGIDIVMISSGAVAAGRSELRQEVGSSQKSLDSVSQRQLFSAVGQAKLINRYYELFRDHGLSCGQVLTTKENFSTRRHYLNQKHCMEVMLAAGVIPVVNENDTVSLTELMFTDNDELSGLIATMMGMDALVILSNIDGVYDGDPADPASHLITDVAPVDDPTRYVQAAKSSLGRGGMGTKMRIARKVASEGLDVIIANGKRPNILVDLITRDDTPCTVFHAAAVEPSSVKKWIAHSEGFAKGEVHVNRGAADALLSGTGASLLAVGVTKIEGDWEKDDVVKVIDPDGRQIALGRAGYSSITAAKSIGRTGLKPMIHSDYLFIEG